jgi:NADP-dependent 3-hydroxy acid dehydrogenase YdfG
VSDGGRLAGQAALVTGASSGIGRASALALADAGAAVVLVARRESRLSTVAGDVEAAGGRALVAPADVTDASAVAEAVERGVTAFDGLDVVVAAAGVLERAERIDELSLEAYRRQRAVNVDGVFYTVRAALPALRESAGTVVLVGSDAGKHAEPSLQTYGATKWWVRGFARNLEAREGDAGVGVALVNPGDTRTELTVDGRPLTEHEDAAEMLAPETVAEAVVFAAAQPGGAVASEVDVNGRRLMADTYRSLR